MSLKFKYEKKEDVPEALREYYVERNGAFEIVVEGMKTQADIDRLSSSLTKERADHKATKEKFSKLADKDVDELLGQLDELDELRAKVEAGEGDKGKNEESIQKRIDAAVKRATGPLQRELDSAKKERDTFKEENGTLKTERTRDKITTAVQSAATKAGVAPTAIDDILLRAERSFEVTDDGKIVTRDGVGVTPGIGTEVWFAELKTKAPHLWPSNVSGGATGNNGSAGTTAGNPFDKKSFHLTNASALVKSDPAKADQMAKVAGFANAAAAIEGNMGGGMPTIPGAGSNPNTL